MPTMLPSETALLSQRPAFRRFIWVQGIHIIHIMATRLDTGLVLTSKFPCVSMNQTMMVIILLIVRHPQATIAPHPPLIVARHPRYQEHHSQGVHPLLLHGNTRAQMMMQTSPWFRSRPHRTKHSWTANISVSTPTPAPSLKHLKQHLKPPHNASMWHLRTIFPTALQCMGTGVHHLVPRPAPITATTMMTCTSLQCPAPFDLRHHDDRTAARTSYTIAQRRGLSPWTSSHDHGLWSAYWRRHPHSTLYTVHLAVASHPRPPTALVVTTPPRMSRHGREPHQAAPRHTSSTRGPYWT